MDDADLLERERRSQASYYRLVVDGHPDSFVADFAGGVQATVVPVSPERSLPNSVVYEDPAAVLECHAELTELYARAGVNAWTVWVRPGDDELAAELERRGHLLDGTPMIMGAPLADLDLAPRVALELDPVAGWDVAGVINDRAYDLEPGSLSALLAGLGHGEMGLLVAADDGKPVACASFHLVEGDCAAEFVATLPEARGRGLSAELMREGLRRALADGAETATLEASPMGRPVYERIGYRPLGQMRMMERRTSAS